jgi:hypothetical protein
VLHPLRDHGDGSYSVDVSHQPGNGPAPGVVVSQPDRPPIPITPQDGWPGSGQGRCPAWLCWLLALLVLVLIILVLIIWLG